MMVRVSVVLNRTQAVVLTVITCAVFIFSV